MTTKTYKICPDCNKGKPVSEFHNNRSSHDGLAAYCAPCATGRVNRRNERKRKEMGEEAYLAHKSAIVAKSRTKPQVRERERQSNIARREALETLRRRHPAEYNQILKQIRQKKGLE